MTVVAGQGEAAYRELIDGLMAGLGDVVEIRPAVARERLPELFAEHDALFFHSENREPVALVLMGLTCAVFMTSDRPLKGFVSLLLVLFVACIGLGNPAGFPRFTFGNVDLMSGISFIPTMIGAFAVSELLRGAMSGESGAVLVQEKVGALFRGIGDVTRRYWLNFIRGSVVGTAKIGRAHV